jgi:hypothetical protein
MLIKGNFGQIQDLASYVSSTMAKVQQEMDTWHTASGATAQDWMDNAGGQFTEVSQAWNQVQTSHQAMLNALHAGVGKANMELQQALSSAASRVGGVSI